MELKKSAVDLTDLAIGVIVLGITVSIGATILITQRDARLTELATVKTTAEAVAVTDAGVPVIKTWVKSVDVVTNATGGGDVILPGNYTVAINSMSGQAVITNVTSEYVTHDWAVNYTWYNTSRADWDLPNKAAIGIGEYGNWFKIIVIVGVAAVVLSLIFLAFRGRGGEQVTGSY